MSAIRLGRLSNETFCNAACLEALNSCAHSHRAGARGPVQHVCMTLSADEEMKKACHSPRAARAVGTQNFEGKAAENARFSGA